VEKVKEDYKAYLQTREGIDNYNAFKEILYTRDDELAKKLFALVAPDLKPRARLSICDVGGGDGRRITELCRRLHERDGCDIILDFIEQSTLQCADFEARKSRIEPFTAVTIFPTELEQVVLKTNYDLIFFIHSIFCLANFSSFSKICARLQPGGKVVVVSNAGDSFLGRLKAATDQHYRDRRYEIDDLRADLERAGSPFLEHSMLTEWSIPAAQVALKLGVILRWLSLGKWRGTETQADSRLLDLALSLAEQRGDRYYFSEREVVFII
jgi:SAM-dependent methyltransferase